MSDVIETLQRSTIHHGHFNDRIYLMDLDPGDLPGIVQDLERLRDQHGYSKIVARVPAGAWPFFECAGYVREALVPGYLINGEDLFFVSRFFSHARRTEQRPRTVARNLALVQDRPPDPERKGGLDLSEVTPGSAGDAGQISRLFADVYPSYPFPIHDPAYLTHSMKVHTRYFTVRRNGRIVAAAGSEIDAVNRCVEMTEFAVSPRCRRQRLATCLLAKMELEMQGLGMRVAFTISRTLSAGMNLTFKKRGFSLGGKLTNNSNISGSIESMWVWYKPLADGDVPLSRESG